MCEHVFTQYNKINNISHFNYQYYTDKDNLVYTICQGILAILFELMKTECDVPNTSSIMWEIYMFCPLLVYISFNSGWLFDSDVYQTYLYSALIGSIVI